MDSNSLNKTAHIRQIEESLERLSELSVEFAAPAPEVLQLLGTAVDNTTAGLVSALNSISDSPKVVRFGHESNWKSYMGSVHRSFFNTIHAVTEEGLKSLCTEKGIDVYNSKRVRMENLIDGIQGISRRNKQKLLSFVGVRPEFMDYIEATVANLDAERQDYWRKWFIAIGSIRNISSHSNSLLRDVDKDRLNAAGLQKLIDGNELSMNTSIYNYCLTMVRDFYNEIR